MDLSYLRIRLKKFKINFNISLILNFKFFLLYYIKQINSKNVLIKM